jgi:hypothetical protein
LQLALDGEGGEVGGEEDGEAARRAREVTAQGGGRAALEAELGMLGRAREVVLWLRHAIGRPASRGAGRFSW